MNLYRKCLSCGYTNKTSRNVLMKCPDCGMRTKWEFYEVIPERERMRKGQRVVIVDEKGKAEGVAILERKIDEIGDLQKWVVRFVDEKKYFHERWIKIRKVI